MLTSLKRDEGIKNFLDSLESQIKLLKNVQSREVRFEKEIKEEKRIVWYLDTKTFELNKPPNYFLLRIRPENDEKYVTDLKCRNPDRYISASHDFSVPKISKSSLKKR